MLDQITLWIVGQPEVEHRHVRRRGIAPAITSRSTPEHQLHCLKVS